MPYLNEAIKSFEAGMATEEDIDTAITLGLNHPMGPLAFADLIGLDTCLAIMKNLNIETCSLLEIMVKKGFLGKKAGRGFYEY